MVDEAGTVIVWFAAFLLALTFIASLAIDVPNLFRHKRQLQTQADAAALAAGGLLHPTLCDEDEIAGAAGEYSGDPDLAALYNIPENPDFAERVDAQIVELSCDAIEVRVTEPGVSWLIPVADLTGVDVTAEARVELQKVTQVDDILPLLVRNQVVEGVDMYLVDESPRGSSRGDVIAGPIEMDRVVEGDSVRWTSPSIVTRAEVHNIGVRYRVRYQDDADCPQNPSDPRNADCYDLESDFGVSHIHAFAVGTAVGTAPARPQLRKLDPAVPPVVLSSHNCFGAVASCLVTVRATVDWLDSVDAALAGASDPDSVAAVNARAGPTGTPVGLEYTKPSVAGSGYPNGYWSGTLEIPNVPGYWGVHVDWSQKRGRTAPSGANNNCNSTPCRGRFVGTSAVGQQVSNVAASASVPMNDADFVHKFFVGGADRSGDISVAGLVTGSNSVDVCDSDNSQCTHSFAAEVVLPGDIDFGERQEIAVSQAGSNDQLLNCDPEAPGIANAAAYIAGGCPRTFGIDESGVCEVGADEHLLDPATCVENFTPNSSNSIERAVTGRVYNDGVVAAPNFQPDCSTNPSHWDDGDLDAWMADPASPRIVGVVVAEDPDSGAGVLPITRFAYFYITGWGDNPCEGAGGNEADVPSGHISGRFIRYAHPNDGGVVGGGDPCPTKGYDPCVPVMTK